MLELIIVAVLGLIIVIAGLAVLDARHWQRARRADRSLDMSARVRKRGPQPTGLTVIIERIGRRSDQE